MIYYFLRCQYFARGNFYHVKSFEWYYTKFSNLLGLCSSSCVPQLWYNCQKLHDTTGGCSRFWSSVPMPLSLHGRGYTTVIIQDHILVPTWVIPSLGTSTWIQYNPRYDIKLGIYGIPLLQNIPLVYFHYHPYQDLCISGMLFWIRDLVSWLPRSMAIVWLMYKDWESI